MSNSEMDNTEMKNSTNIIRAGLKKRYARERRFRLYGIFSLMISFAFLLVLLSTIFSKGWPAFQQTYVKLDVVLDESVLNVNKNSSEDEIYSASYDKVVRNSLREKFPGVKGRKQKRALKNIVSNSAQYTIRDKVIANP